MTPFTSEHLDQLQDVYAGINPNNGGARSVHVYIDATTAGLRVAMRETQEHAGQELGNYWLPSGRNGLEAVVKYVLACVRECLLLQTKKDAMWRGENVSLR